MTTLSDLELWTCEISYVSWIWFGLVDLWYYISQTLQAMDMRLAPLDTAKIEFSTQLHPTYLCWEDM